MTTEEAIEAFLIKHSDNEQMPNSDAYQMLLEELGDQLLPGLLSLLKSPMSEIRGTAVNLLSIRRPHEAQVAAAIAPLIRDGDGFVMLTATDRLAEFPLEMVQPFLDDAYQMVLDHQDAKDVVPSIAAMRLCLRSDFASFKEALLPRLLSMVLEYECGFEHFLLFLTLKNLGLVEEEDT
jgi:hypothetical protein